MHRIVAAAVALGLVAAAARGAARKPPREVTDTDVDRAIGEVSRYLFAQQQTNGLFRYYHHQVPVGGPTALTLLALLEAGEQVNDPRIRKGLDALIALKTKNLYVIATRVMALSQPTVNRVQRYRRQLQADVKWLTLEAGRHGAWGYGGPQRDGDNSCSQFALLALWEADRAEMKIPPVLIRQVERVWLRRRKPDHGWTYAALPDARTASTLTMTTAAIASLYICQDVLTRDCRPYAHQRPRDAAWAFLAAGLKDDYHANGYLAFCVQRVGMASGRKFIGDMDWFAVAAEKLCEPNPRGRSFRGQWGPVVRAAFELLFLSRGRIPLTFNKLRYGDGQEWNLHGRDVAHFAEYMRREFERRLRWQIVKITDDVQRMLDAPILLVAGTGKLTFTDEQWARLREYTLRGGTLLFLPTHGSEEFLGDVKARLETLYAASRAQAGGHYALEPLPPEHPLYVSYRPVKAGAKAAPMWGVSDGTRLLAVVCRRDLACAWHRRETDRGAMDYDLGVNFFMVTTGANRLRSRLRPVFAYKGGEVRHRARVAWLKHTGNFCTQPYALDYLSQKLTAENRVAIDVTAAVPITAKALAGHDLAWMTGSEAFELSDQQRRALRKWLDGGGTLFVNAVGGARAFADSADAMLKKLFQGTGAAVGPPPLDSPLVTGRAGDFRGPPLGKLERTRPLQRSAAGRNPPLRVYVVGKRTVAMFAPHGIHDTLDGHTTWEARSFMPGSAREVAANVVLYALSQRKK